MKNYIEWLNSSRNVAQKLRYGEKPCKVKSRIADTASVEAALPHPASTRLFSYEELKDATNNFEPAGMLGEGGFGRVFKGVLSDGTAVAIKKLSSGGHQGDKEFLVEVEMLSRLHHRNLVKLVGYYSCRDLAHNLLCYELVPNGSLDSWLHGIINFEQEVSILSLEFCYIQVSKCDANKCLLFRSLGSQLSFRLGN
ncbi:hypothetical protein BHE74_00032627 [Ensete ventricosum]|nr:hypothetical protein BHE74_00032627 [Ensete ventricosum]